MVKEPKEPIKEIIIIKDPCFETEDYRVANDLYNSGEWCKPQYDTHRSKFIIIKRTKR